MSSFAQTHPVVLPGPLPVTSDKQSRLQGMDPQVLIDALAVIMGHEEKELCKPGNAALILILDTATTILGSKERVRSGHATGIAGSNF